MKDDAFAAVGDVRSNIVRLVLELLCVRRVAERDYLIVYFCHWFQEGALWKQSVEKSLRDFVSTSCEYASAELELMKVCYRRRARNGPFFCAFFRRSSRSCRRRYDCLSFHCYCLLSQT